MTVPIKPSITYLFDGVWCGSTTRITFAAALLISVGAKMCLTLGKTRAYDLWVIVYSHLEASCLFVLQLQHGDSQLKPFSGIEEGSKTVFPSIYCSRPTETLIKSTTRYNTYVLLFKNLILFLCREPNRTLIIIHFIF